MQRPFFAAILFLAMGLALLPARAGDAAKPDKPDKPPPGTGVEMPILISPMVVDGKLMSYAYVSSTIVATSPAAAIQVRAKTPFIQDAYVRDVNGASIVKKDAPDQVDSAALVARLLAVARRVAGPGKVAEVRLTEVQISRMRPQDQQPASP